MASINGQLEISHDPINRLNDLIRNLNVKNKEEPIKIEFETREGCYRAMPEIQYLPKWMGYNHSNIPVKVSFISTPDPLDPSFPLDRICFNVGRELFVYNYHGVSKQHSEKGKNVDKRVYKGTFPTCHDFNQSCLNPEASLLLLIGFSAGQIQLLDPIKKGPSKLYNEERFIDKTKVTCIKWAPSSNTMFLASYSSGNLYVYKDDLNCGTASPTYQVTKSGEGFTISSCKSKSTRNPMYRWSIGEGAIHEFAFSPCGKFLATVSQDGFLRIFDFEAMELVGRMRSYFGGLLCLSWSPDGKYIVVGGEDDLITIWSMMQRRVMARGQGHKSWVSVVAFDPYNTSTNETMHSTDSADGFSDDDQPSMNQSSPSSHDGAHSSYQSSSQRNSLLDKNNPMVGDQLKVPSSSTITSYRIGSIGHDTHMCLWELNDDILKQPVGRSRTSILVHSPSSQVPSSSFLLSQCANSPGSSAGSAHHKFSTSYAGLASGGAPSSNHHHDSSDEYPLLSSTTVGNPTSPPLILNPTNGKSDKKEHKRNFSLVSKNSDKNSLNKGIHKMVEDPSKLLGTQCCPRLGEVPMLEPFVCKKISQERLTGLAFREDCFIVACQEGYVRTWARPGRNTDPSSVNSNLELHPDLNRLDDNPIPI